MSKYYGVLFIFVLIAVSGAIAYVGDIVGRRMGRKRLSLFGLRPRHTAIVISVISGMLITIVTLALAMALSENVRIGLHSVGQLRAETKQLRGEKRRLTQEVKLGEQQLVQTRTELTRNLSATEEDLKREQAKLQDTQQKRQEAEQERQAAEAAAEHLGRKIRELNREEADLQHDYAYLQHASINQNALLGYLAQDRLRAVTFDAGQPLDVLRVDPSATVYMVRRRLDEFIAHLDTAVREAGAKPEAGGKQAVVVTHYEQDPKTKQRVLVDANHTLDGLAASIKQAFKDAPGLRSAVVQASCVRNEYPGEPVYVDFVVFPNVLVFKKGTRLADVTLPAGQEDWQAMEALVLLLKGKVRAVSEGKVIPKLDPSQPHAGGQSGSVGGMSYRDLFSPVHRVLQLHGPAHITALAKDDTWTIGPLDVELRVEPVDH